ncbi:hypothetical protein [Actinotalea sp. C106]|uniref:hypothetical protein n=1 Tax=Actinotalea sp. C106 TaxID=2908644 RepID=UPI00202819E7|nr:hypothetical protein [Actinotalea sp. C106]
MTGLDREFLADWIECALLVRRGRALGFDALYGYADEVLEAGAAQVSLAVAQMTKRAQVLGEAYPFMVHGDVAVRGKANAVDYPYSGLLLLAPGGPVRHHLWASPTEEMVVAFERLTEVSVQHLWGESGRAVRFGWPSEAGRPPSFDEAVPWLAQKMGIAVGAGYRQPRRKDGGVDVVAWRPFPDGRPGFPIALVQCTLQENLVAKASDVDIRLWASWLSMDLEPVIALATPKTIRQGTVWDELALKGMVLERLRLTGLAPVGPMTGATAGWCVQTVERLRGTMRGVEGL